MTAFSLLKLTPEEFAASRWALRIGPPRRRIWLVPSLNHAAELVARGRARSRVWTINELTDFAPTRRTVAGAIAAAGIAFGDVVLDEESAS